jgi:uncharacterized protein YdhG (YjbR/CyaY superfamily)
VNPTSNSEKRLWRKRSNDRLLSFASFTHHIGFFPLKSGVRAFESKLSKFKHAAGSVRFPHDNPLPNALIRQIVKFRVAENRKKAKE